MARMSTSPAMSQAGFIRIFNPLVKQELKKLPKGASRGEITTVINRSATVAAKRSGVKIYTEQFISTKLKWGKGFISTSGRTILDQSTNSFNALKRYLGGNRPGYAWHHIVEQHEANLNKFGLENIHNTKNVIEIPHGAGTLHQNITNYYNGIDQDLNLRLGINLNTKVRDYVKTLSFDKQYEFGINTIKKFDGVSYIKFIN